MYEVMSAKVKAEGWMHRLACTCLEDMADQGIVFHVVSGWFTIKDPEVGVKDLYPTSSIYEGPALLAPYVSRIVSRLLWRTSTEMLGVLNCVADDNQFSSVRTPIHRVYGRRDWPLPYIHDQRLLTVRIAFGALVARIFDMILKGHPLVPVEFVDNPLVDGADDTDQDDWIEEGARSQAASNDPHHQQTALVSVHATMQ